MKKTTLIFALGAALVSVSALAQPDNESMMYGAQLMTEQERVEMRNRMHAADSLEERQKIRQEHHEIMRERAREKGITLPEMPPEGAGMGPGPHHDGSMGNGMGQHQDMGHGMGHGMSRDGKMMRDDGAQTSE